MENRIEEYFRKARNTMPEHYPWEFDELFVVASEILAKETGMSMMDALATMSKWLKEKEAEDLGL